MSNDIKREPKAYKVEVKTTNAKRDTTKRRDGKYQDCTDGVLIVVTDSPIAIIEQYEFTQITLLGHGVTI